MPSDDLWRVPAHVRRLEALGYSAAISPETNRDAFLPLVIAAEHTHAPRRSAPRSRSPSRARR